MNKQLVTFALIPAIALSAVPAIYAQQEAATSFSVLTPKEGQTLYGDKLPILFNVEGFTLVPQGGSEGQGHILLWLDQEAPTVENATVVSESTFIYSDVPYGDHTLKAQLVTSDNESLTPPQEVTVNFKTEILPATGEASISSGFDKTTAIVILSVVALVILAAWWYTKDEDDDVDSEENLSKTRKKTVKKAKPKSKVKKKTKR